MQRGVCLKNSWETGHVLQYSTLYFLILYLEDCTVSLDQESEEGHILMVEELFTSGPIQQCNNQIVNTGT